MQITHGKYKQEKRRAQVEHQPSPEEREGNQRRATARAKTQIRRDLLTSQADRMLTLTYKENMTDRSRAVADLARFHRSMSKKFPHYQAVAVLEWQQRGAAHFHLGISGFYDADIVRDVWRTKRLIVFELVDEYYPVNRNFFAAPVAFGGWFYEIERVT